MELEEETVSFLIFGYSAVMIFAVAVVIRLWVQSKDSDYTWLLLHFLLFTVGVAIWLNRIGQPDPSLRPDGGAMLSEENSLFIGIAGLVWAMSMFALLIGVYRVAQNRRTQA
ncbi:hypothetical protein CBW65_10280 [Tumebacillus avium]|uniref:Uncharacterized protein n=1 Tax=Tumebacillus avium TaxID=1903704 RepID=A0A1Y0IPQ2_9BACL|nr:hypothetical protein [Tumebacillus avium]ARU61343.1 hypothetical protein CBW65_10280 [Tumebacillus avium]